MLYDGSHYDPLYLDYAGIRQTVFQRTDIGAYDQAMNIARQCHLARQYVDFKNYTLRCKTCSTGLKGNKEANEHAKATGHINFEEY